MPYFAVLNEGTEFEQANLGTGTWKVCGQEH